MSWGCVAPVVMRKPLMPAAVPPVAGAPSPRRLQYKPRLTSRNGGFHTHQTPAEPVAPANAGEGAHATWECARPPLLAQREWI